MLILMLTAVGVKRWNEIADRDKPVDFKFTAAFIPAAIGILAALIGSIFISRESFVLTGDPTLLTIAVTVIIISAFFINNRKQLKIAVGAITVFILYSAIMSGTFVLSDFTSPNSKDPMPRTEMIEILQNMVDPEKGGNWGRIIRYSNDPVNVLSTTNQPYTFYPNLGTYFGIPDAFGYHNLAPKSRLDLLRGIQDEMVLKSRGIAVFTPPADLSNPILFNMGVRYVLADSEIEGLIAKIESESFMIYDLYDQPNQSSPPLRASIIPSIETNFSGEWIDIGMLPTPVIHLDEPGHFVAETDYEFPGLLVYNEGNAPGWEVKVDGERRELIIHEGFSMAVNLENGMHTIEFQYRMPGLKEGMAVSVTSLLIWIVIGVFITQARKEQFQTR